MKAHLLFRDRDVAAGVEPDAHVRALMKDLGLDLLVEAMADGDSFLAGVATQVITEPLDDPDAIRYRQAVLADVLDHPEMLRELYGRVVGTIEARRKLWGYSWSARHPRSVLSGARECLQLYAEHLRQLRAMADAWSAHVRSEGLTRLFTALQEDLDDGYLRTLDRQLRRLRFPDGLLLSAGLAADLTGRDYVLRAPEQDRLGWRERLGISARTRFSFTLPARDEGGVQALDELCSYGVNEVANAAAQAADHVGDYFALLRVELGFYLGCLNLAERLAAEQMPRCWPQVGPNGDGVLSFDDLRDAALALQSDDPVVGTSADASGKSLVVVTGAHSGGKTTFLRSVGAAQLMAQSGMFVCAADLRASVVTGVFTHFVREEDRSMTRGRLEEELDRMRALVSRLRAGSLVLLNESFHSTNEREGSEIARQVVRALRESGNRVVVVTHQYDFASSHLGEDGRTTLFLRAVLGPDGRADHRLVRGLPSSSAYGRELYQEIFAQPA